jgi:protein-arginine kinase activator protein McsA
MWWVLLPCGVVRNEASFDLHSAPPANLRGRHFSAADRIRKVERLKAEAVKAEKFERAAQLRDVINAMNQKGGA